ncbi:MAG: hypothetical protein JST76_09055 [Bacteroidetes bacterium]|nr:hypothetical protein [Bacteroidota bacterium]
MTEKGFHGIDFEPEERNATLQTSPDCIGISDLKGGFNTNTSGRMRFVFEPERFDTERLSGIDFEPKQSFHP